MAAEIAESICSGGWIRKMAHGRKAALLKAAPPETVTKAEVKPFKRAPPDSSIKDQITRNLILLFPGSILSLREEVETTGEEPPMKTKTGKTAAFRKEAAITPGEKKPLSLNDPNGYLR